MTGFTDASLTRLSRGTATHLLRIDEPYARCSFAVADKDVGPNGRRLLLMREPLDPARPYAVIDGTASRRRGPRPC